MGDGFRLTAVQCWIKDILEGSFVNNEEGPSKVVLNSGQKIGRVNIVAIVTSVVQDVPFRFIIDDSTGQIEVIDFEAERELSVGDFVRVIAVPKEYVNTKYLILEAVKKTDPEWLKLKVKIVVKSRDLKEEILSFIKEKDQGSGVSFEDLEIHIGDVEQAINFLLEKGYLFEIKPGFLKVLD